jgi:hypothetical protein
VGEGEGEGVQGRGSQWARTKTMHVVPSPSREGEDKVGAHEGGVSAHGGE